MDRLTFNQAWFKLNRMAETVTPTTLQAARNYGKLLSRNCGEPHLVLMVEGVISNMVRRAFRES